jgi:molybdopterin-guanine dinucleotide biosynthesis protein A
MSKEMIEYIIEYKSDKLVKYSYASGRHHYLAGVYSKILLSEIEKLFLSGNMVTAEKEKHFSIVNLLKNVEAEIIHPENLPFYNDELFFNLNTPEDFEYLKKKI